MAATYESFFLHGQGGGGGVDILPNLKHNVCMYLDKKLFPL